MTFDVIDRRDTEPSPGVVEPVLTEEPRLAVKTCKCGCGEPVAENRDFKRGHARRVGSGVATAGSSSVLTRGGAPWSAEDMAVMTAAAIALLLGGSAWLAQRSKLPPARMSLDEATAIATPATRIALRHIKVKRALQGDLADTVALASSVMAYTMRLLTAQDWNNEYDHRAGAPGAANGTDWTAAYRVDHVSAENGASA